MDGAELSKPEFAYLLAAVHASGLVGVEDPQLFPANKSARDSSYRKGRKQLEANGWIQPVPEHADEYDLNPALLQMVAVVGAPRFVVGTTRGAPGGDRNLVLHYLAGDRVVELWAPSKKSYLLANVPDSETFHARIAEMLQLEVPPQKAHFTLQDTDFKKLESLAQAGKSKEAQQLLAASGPDPNSEVSNSLLAALSVPPSGEVVVIRPEMTEIVAGRRVRIYGTHETAWRVSRQSADTQGLELATCDPASIGALVTEWMEELTEA